MDEIRMIDEIEKGLTWETRQCTVILTVRELHKYGCRGMTMWVYNYPLPGMTSFDRSVVVPITGDYDHDSVDINRACLRLLRIVTHDFNEAFPDTNHGIQTKYPDMAITRGVKECKITFFWSFMRRVGLAYLPDGSTIPLDEHDRLEYRKDLSCQGSGNTVS